DVTVECIGDVPAPASPTASDNCDPAPVITYDASTNGTCPTLVVRTWIATDVCGNSSTNSQTITVDDTTAPVITCPANIVVGECGATAAFAATATDNCDPAPTITYNIGGTNITSPHTFPVGTNTVEAVATDLCGNTASCSFTVTVEALPVVADATVTATVGEAGPAWPVSSAYPSFSMCIDPLVSNYYLDLVSLTSGTALQTNVLNAFTINPTNVPANWLTYWASKGVDGANNSGGWELQMWQIINGNAPFFYIKYTGSDYLLVDGLQYALLGGEPILRVPGDYPQHNYQYTGTVQDVNGCASSFFDIFFEFNTVPTPTIVGSASVCAGSVETYATENGQSGYTWTVSGGTGTSTTNSIAVTWGPAGPGSVSVNYVNSSGCTAAAATSLAVSIHALPVPTITGTDMVCPGSVETYATESGQSGYTWTVVGGTGSSTTESITVTWGGGGTGSVSVVYMNTSGCTAASPTVKPVTIAAVADLALNASVAPSPAYVGENLVYTMIVSNEGPCTASGVQLQLMPVMGQVQLMVTNGANPGMACPGPGPSAWWRADNNANDSVNGNNGTTAGGVAYSNGIVAQAFSFDGTNDSVSVPDDSSLRPSNFTIEGWIKIQDVTGVHVVMGKRVGAGTLDSYSVWMESGVLYASIANSNSSGAFLRYPEFPTYSYFQSSDLVNLQPFAFKLKVPTDPVSQFIQTNLSAPTLVLLTAYSGGTNDALHAALIADLNILIGNGSIYDPVRFAGVTLSQESQYILGRNPTGEDEVRLNRYLIRDAYPAEFAPDVFPQLNQWFHVAYCFDAATDVQALYINGELVDVGFETNAIGYDTHPLYIGADDNGGLPGYFFKGLIDELSLYGRALTGSEIQAIYQAGAGGKCSSPSTVLVGNIPANGTRQVQLVTMPVTCGTLPGGAIAMATTVDPDSTNSVSLPNVTVSDLPSSLWRLGIEEVSPNTESVRITWPIICGTTGLEAAPSLNSPIVWTPLTVPVQIINNQQNTLVPATNAFRYFRLKSP
ncbi:MAG: HYR domain-containing protein, partial [Verrucomicrobia bacterium]|nr:HYR domain-containing protein [Verrucomicrobiota bacterium]